MPDDAMQPTAGGTDPVEALALIQSLSQGGASPEGLMQLLASQSGNPTTSMLASLLMNGLGEEDEVATDDDADDNGFAEIDRLLSFAEADQAFDTPGSDTDEEVEALREVNDTLSSALGACSRCWGGDENCRACGGDGAPGSALPDQRLFNELILPTVRRINQSRHAGSKTAPQRKHPNFKEKHDG